MQSNRAEKRINIFFLSDVSVNLWNNQIMANSMPILFHSKIAIKSPKFFSCELCRQRQLLGENNKIYVAQDWPEMPISVSIWIW